jgi:hypothetical protein
VTREIVAHHDPRVQTSLHVGAAQAVHRAVPTLTLVELLDQAAHPGPVSRALEHVRDCAHCGIGDLCATGERLAAQIAPPPTRTRGWRTLRASAVAEAEARKREEGAA